MTATALPFIGHAPLWARLTRSLLRDRLHHALLFEGPAGVGRTRVARALAALANCEAPSGADACGRCRTCTALERGVFPDWIEVSPQGDRASGQIAVAEVREVLRKTSYHRYMGRKRFIVVEPAEALAPASANALLKTLEEPPADTHFILIATNASALLPTLRSRTQHIRFGVVATNEIAAWLQSKGVDQAEGRAAACHGRPAVALDGDVLDERRALRDGLLTALAGGLPSRNEWAVEHTGGKRQEWTARLDVALDVLDELLRDAALSLAAATVPRIHPDVADTTEPWGRRLGPDGLARCATAVRDARDQLAVFVAGRSVVDALLARIATELGS